jgi:hypothetical protein
MIRAGARRAPSVSKIQKEDVMDLLATLGISSTFAAGAGFLGLVLAAAFALRRLRVRPPGVAFDLGTRDRRS